MGKGKKQRRQEQQERERIEEEEDDLFQTEQEKQLTQIKTKNPSSASKKFNRSNDVNQDNNDELDSIEDEGQEQDATFQKLVNVHKLILKNQISKKNAFDIDISDISLSKYSWVNSSNFLKNLSEIHGYKVDNIQTESYNLLSMLSRADGVEDEQEDGDQDKNAEAKKQKHFKDISSEELLNKVNRYQNILSFGSKTQESKMENIDVVKYDIEFDLDPLLKQTLSKFDDSSNKGLFLTNTYMDTDITLKLESQVQYSDADETNNNNKKPKPKSVKKSMYHRFIVGDKGKLDLSKKQKLCPKLIAFKKRVEEDAQKLGMKYNISDSNFVSVQPQQLSQKLSQDENADINDNLDIENIDNIINQDLYNQQYYEDLNYNQNNEEYNELLQAQNQMDENHVGETYVKMEQDQESDEEIQNENQQEQIDSDIENDENKENDQIEQEEDDDEQSGQKEFDLQDADEKMKNIGKGEVDESLIKKLKVDEVTEKKKRRKRNLLQKNDDEMKNQEIKKTNEFSIKFDEILDEELEENKEDVFCLNTLSKKKQAKINLKKIDIFEKVKHVKLSYFQFQLDSEKYFQSLTLCRNQAYEDRLQRLNHPQEGDDLNIDQTDIMVVQNQEEILNQPELIYEEEEEEDEEYDFDQGDNKEQTQVKIRDLKKKVWKYIKAKIQKKPKKNSKKQELQHQKIQFSDVQSNIPNIMGEISKKISLQSSFITILHLCNENDLRLNDEDGEFIDFTIETDPQAIARVNKEEKQKNEQIAQELQEKQESEKIQEE